MEEEQRKTKQMKKEENKRMDKDKKLKTEWVLCSEDWRDIVITYIPQLNNIPIENNYADISHEEIKKAYKQNKRRSQEERVKGLHMLSSFYNFVPKFLLQYTHALKRYKTS